MEKKIVATNRKAHHNYAILETFEAGIVLAGYEVKALRTSQVNLTDGMVRFSRNEAILENVQISPYLQQSSHVMDYNPTRGRKLLLHRKEIDRLEGRVREKGLTVVPLEIYFSKNNMAKVIIGLAKGKNTVDKRDSIKKHDMDRDMQRNLRENFKNKVNR